MPVDVYQIALPLPLPRQFDYLPAPGMAVHDDAIGCRVRVPFGSRELVGVVTGIGTASGEDGLRSIQVQLDPEPVFHGELLHSLRWLARYTHAPLGETLATGLPTSLRRGEPMPDTHAWAWRLTEAGATALPAMRAGRPRQLAERLRAGACDEDLLDAQAGPGWRSPARSLDKRGLAERVAVPASQLAPTPQAGPTPNAGQQAAIDAIDAAHQGFAPILLDGVTGSGKTEVYLQAIAACLARGKQALVLVPEIGLTPQMLSRFRARLGVPVHALHSGLNDGERARVWAAAWRGEARVVVGTRSAVFTPLPDAGLIVIDEEHDGSYKQLDGIRYHARDFALVRGKALNVPVVLGSATPSLESLHNAHSGRHVHLRLTERAGVAQPPSVRVLDVRKRPLQAGLSPELLDAIDSTLRAGGQVLVFKNRRGYAPVLLCHDCGWSAQCQRCDAAMTVHGGGRRLQCHHCGSRRPVPPACPDCGGLALQPQGVGTERLEELLAERFNEFPVLRVDRGSTRRRDALVALMAKLGESPGILVGTQMLAKGHDLAHLTLVAVVGIDEGLFSADFRAGEKLAQLLIQVAGRAGRAEKPGEVLLQTHHPEHPLLQTLIHGGYHAFAETELTQREEAGFPPFAHLAQQTGAQFAGGLPLWVIGSVLAASVLTELGPLLTAIVMMARVGAAIAAELASMKVTEQIDALYAMGRDPILFLVVPRVVAGVLIFAPLVILADFTGIAAGWGIGLLAVDGLTSADIIYGMRFYFRPWSVIFSMIKATFFGFAISFIACFVGLRGRGGAEGVGRTTTTAVVTTTIALMILDVTLAPMLKWF